MSVHCSEAYTLRWTGLSPTFLRTECLYQRNTHSSPVAHLKDLFQLRIARSNPSEEGAFAGTDVSLHAEGNSPAGFAGGCPACLCCLFIDLQFDVTGNDCAVVLTDAHFLLRMCK